MGSSHSTTSSWKLSSVEDVDDTQCKVAFIAPINVWMEEYGGCTFPQQNETIKCSVYSWRNKTFHESVVIIPRITDYDGLIIDLVKDETGSNFWIRASRAKREKNIKTEIKEKDIIIKYKEKDWIYFGETKTTIFKICEIANDVTNNFEEYHLVSNNCQIFVEKLLSKLLGRKVKHETTTTKIKNYFMRLGGVATGSAGVVVPAVSYAAAGTGTAANTAVVASSATVGTATSVTGTGVVGSTATVGSTGSIGIASGGVALLIPSILGVITYSTAIHTGLVLQHHRGNYLDNKENYIWDTMLQQNHQKYIQILLCGYIHFRVKFIKYVSNDIKTILLKYMEGFQVGLNENIKNLMISNCGMFIGRIKRYDYICYTYFGVETYTKNQKKIWKFQVKDGTQIVVGIVSQESIVREDIDDGKDTYDKCGYLHIMPKYQRRWVILDGALLSYFKTKPKNKMEKENNCIKSFDLNEFSIDKISYNTTYQFKLISNCNGKEQAFIASSHYDMLCWRKAIENAQKGIMYKELNCEPLMHHRGNQVHLRYGLRLSNGHIFNNDIESKLCEGFNGLTSEDIDDVIIMELNLCESKGILSYKIDGILKESEAFNNLDVNKSYKLAIGFYDISSIALIL